MSGGRQRQDWIQSEIQEERDRRRGPGKEEEEEEEEVMG